MSEGSQTSPSGRRVRRKRSTRYRTVLTKSQDHGKDTLTPVTIKQLHDATQENTDAEFLVDGAAISQVCSRTRAPTFRFELH